MQTRQEITTKTLHDTTGKIIRAVKRGQTFAVSLDGETSALIVPPHQNNDPSWAEIMADVWAAQKRPGPRRPNPILAERKKRLYGPHLR